MNQSAVAAQDWNNPILTGEQVIPRARQDLEPLIVCYPAPVRVENLFTSFGFRFEGVQPPILDPTVASDKDECENDLGKGSPGSGAGLPKILEVS